MNAIQVIDEREVLGFQVKTYGDTENTGIVNKVARGQFTYYVDATTGEIIGGSTSDEIYWENFHFNENKINKNLKIRGGKEKWI